MSGWTILMLVARIINLNIPEIFLYRSACMLEQEIIKSFYVLPEFLLVLDKWLSSMRTICPPSVDG